MKVEWNGQVGPAFVAGLVQIAAMLIGGAVLWTQLTDKVTNTGEQVAGVRTAVTNLRVDLKASQVERQAQSEKLGRLETALAFISDQFKRIESRLDSGSGAKP